MPRFSPDINSQKMNISIKDDKKKSLLDDISNDEIRYLHKRIDSRLKRITQDSEIAGEPNFVLSSADDLPMIINPDKDNTNVSGGLNARGIINRFNDLEQDKGKRLGRYDLLEKTIEHPDAEGILITYADEATVEDLDGQIFHVSHPKEEIVDAIYDMFERIGLYDKSWNIVYNMCGFGDDFWEVIPSLSSSNIQRLIWIPRKKIERIEENGVLIGFKPTEDESDDKNGYIYNFNKTHLARERVGNDEQDLIHPWRILHFRIPSTKYGCYGKAVIDSIIISIEELKLMKKAMLIARVTRAPERRVYTVDVGNLIGEKAIKYAHEAVSYGRKKRRLDIFNNSSEKMDLVADIFGSTEDIVIPKRQGTDGNSVDTLAAANALDQIADIEFIRDEIFPPVGIPRAYLYDDTFANANTNLSSKNIHFSKKIRRIQRFFLYQIYKLAIIELRLQGYSKQDIEDVVIYMNNPSNLDEQQKLEIEGSKWTLVSSILASNSDRVFYPDYLIYKNVLRLDDEEIVELMKLSQLQQAGRNIFDAMDEDEKPEGADDLQDPGMITPVTPDAAAQGGGGGGGGGQIDFGGAEGGAPAEGGEMPEGGEAAPEEAPEPEEGGEDVPAPIQQVLGPPPQETETADVKLDFEYSYAEALNRKQKLIKKISKPVFTEEKQDEVEKQIETMFFKIKKKTKSKYFSYESFELDGSLGHLKDVPRVKQYMEEHGEI